MSHLLKRTTPHLYSGSYSANMYQNKWKIPDAYAISAIAPNQFYENQLSQKQKNKKTPFAFECFSKDAE